MASERVLDVMVRRYVFDTDRPFDRVLDGIFSGISQPDITQLFSELAASGTYQEFSSLVGQAQGSAGLMRFLQLDLDGALSLDPQAQDWAGRRLVRLIAGNPVTMGEMTRHVPDAGSYAPVTILIEETPAKGTRVAYDSVVSAIAPYDNAAASEVAERLDAEVLGLLREATGVQAPAAPLPSGCRRILARPIGGSDRMNAVTAAGGARPLADGNQVPLLGLGVWQVPDGRECVDAVRWALETGYRHIDTAQAYGNEESVGRALRDSGVPRDQVFITTKFLPRRNDPVAEAEKSLRRLGVEQIDLYLVHWPEGVATRAWAGLERARELGLARSIGVSNFGAAELDAVIAAGTVPPAVNQVQFNPRHYRRALLDECGRHNVAVEAYSPLGTGRLIADPTVAKIAQRTGRTPTQVLLRWCLQHGLIVITKSTHLARIQENAQIFDLDLSADDMAELDALDRTGGTDRALEAKWW
jgi:diketogulonate reductase-like aldo/keto reductase